MSSRSPCTRSRSATTWRTSSEVPTSSLASASVGVVVVFFGINLRGVSASALTEDGVVLVKLIALCAISAAGVGHFSPHRLAPLANKGVGGLVVGAASIFVAYEGFELLAYDYDDIENPKRTLPRALLPVGPGRHRHLRPRHHRRTDAGLGRRHRQSEGGCVRDRRTRGIRRCAAAGSRRSRRCWRRVRRSTPPSSPRPGRCATSPTRTNCPCASSGR